MKQKISFFATLLLAAIFVLGSCSEDKGNFPGEGSVKLRLSLAGISDPAESDTRSALAAPKTEKFYTTNPDGETLTELTIEELPSSSTRSVQDMATGTYVRVYLYKRGGAADGDYYTDGILRAGDNSVFLMVDSNTPYYVKAVSYNSTTEDDVPGSVTANMSAATLTGLSADKDVLYAEAEITSGEGGSAIGIDLTFSHKFSLVRVVADNSVYTTGTITACSATLSNKYEASLALDGGALTAGTTSPGLHSFTWTSPNATAVTSNSATVYTGAQTTHVLAFPSITAGGTTYTGTSVTFNKTFEPGKTYRLTVRFKGVIPEIPPDGGTYPSGITSYVGAFWKASQTGERLIRIPVGTATTGNFGNWSAVVAFADERWPGDTAEDRLKNIVLDTSESADQGIKWWDRNNESPADMNNPTNDATYQVAGNATGVSGTVASDDTIKFRIGLKHPYTATDEFPARYAVVVVTYGTPAKTFNLYLRQGEDPDYVWSPSENYPYNGSTPRTSAVKFSPYNLTDPAGGDPDSVAVTGAPDVGLPIYGATFTDYPTQAGYFFKFNYNRQAFHPVSRPNTAITDWSHTQTGSTYWDPEDTELCPQGKPLASGSSADFRRPTDGANNTSAHSSGIIADSEMRQSLWEVPQSSTTSSTAGSVWGFYADGFFDRRSHKHTAYGNDGGENIAVSIKTEKVAYIGRLFYNRDHKRSLFFPVSGVRGNDSTLRSSGLAGFYWSSSSSSWTAGWVLLVQGESVSSRSANRYCGYSVRCVRDEP